MRHIKSIALTIIFAILTIAYFGEFLQIGNTFLSKDISLFCGLLTGSCIYIIIVILNIIRTKSREQNQWFRTFTHELTHALTALLFFRKVIGFSAFSKDGSVQHTGKGGSNFVISLTPYCLPIYTITFIIIRQIIVSNLYFYFDIFIGFTYLFHIINFIRDAKPHQPDLKEHGLIFSYSFIILMNLLFMAMILLVSIGGFSTYWKFLYSGQIEIFSYFKEGILAIISMLQST